MNTSPQADLSGNFSNSSGAGSESSGKLLLAYVQEEVKRNLEQGHFPGYYWMASDPDPKTGQAHMIKVTSCHASEDTIPAGAECTAVSDEREIISMDGQFFASEENLKAWGVDPGGAYVMFWLGVEKLHTRPDQREFQAIKLPLPTEASSRAARLMLELS